MLWHLKTKKALYDMLITLLYVLIIVRRMWMFVFSLASQIILALHSYSIIWEMIRLTLRDPAYAPILAQPNYWGCPIPLYGSTEAVLGWGRLGLVGRSHFYGEQVAREDGIKFDRLYSLLVIISYSWYFIWWYFYKKFYILWYTVCLQVAPTWFQSRSVYWYWDLSVLEFIFLDALFYRWPQTLNL